ncbi:baseplate assembly protein [Litchfieldella anticariensis FP35 = DSM 16096]|uniref:Baseplate assembly protein n=1 Tax=Litchfieldella anticariensis (strain DSM 16096 / CECT 5854 / CIP 108499 / LMG 22089 / FP35) TaxID=1121939 RepID=S2L3X8_LITA3|nr:GPW/gp25 family protein [Halomonas anticariensis]EPC02414.1 baseplate assembly protein [Halomonas anticariensis FP35 = DSM 16096]
MPGMNASNGRALDELEHLQQSVSDILTTPIGSRVMRREYGSLLPELIDQPLHGATALRAYSATVVALMKWEPRLRVQQITRLAPANRPGTLILEMTARRTDTGETVGLTVPLGTATGATA